MLFYIDIRAALMRVNRSPPDEIIALFKEVVDAAEAADPINAKIYVSALNLYGGFLSVLPAQRLAGFKLFKKAYLYAKEHLPKDENIRITVALNYANAFADLALKQGPNAGPDAVIFKEVDNTLKEVLELLPKDHENMADLLARYIMIKMRRMEFAAAIKMGEQAIAMFKSQPQNAMVRDKIRRLESVVAQATKVRNNARKSLRKSMGRK
jgi:hypothetical protein